MDFFAIYMVELALTDLGPWAELDTIPPTNREVLFADIDLHGDRLARRLRNEGRKYKTTR